MPTVVKVKSNIGVRGVVIENIQFWDYNARAEELSLLMTGGVEVIFRGDEAQHVLSILESLAVSPRPEVG